MSATPYRALELLVQRGERELRLVGGPDRPQRVVLVQLRQPEDGHDRVTDELLDRRPVPDSTSVMASK